MATQIKVPRVKLLAALEAKQKKAVDAYKREMERFRDAEKEWPGKAIAAYEAALKQLTADVAKLKAATKRGGKPWVTAVSQHATKYRKDLPLYNVMQMVLPATPQKPARLKACQLEQMIEILKLSEQELVTVTEGSVYAQLVCEV